MRHAQLQETKDNTWLVAEQLIKGQMVHLINMM